MVYKVIIVEDELNALEALKSLLELLEFPIEIVGEFSTVKETITFLVSNKVDIIFMDIEIQDGVAFDILRSVKNITAEIIFTSAYSQYAIEAIKSNAIDYLLKPIDPEELIITWKKTVRNIEIKRIAKGFCSEDKVLKINTNDGFIKLQNDDIFHLKSEGAYTKIYHRGGVFLASKNIKYFETTLPSDLFIRTHQSYLIHKSHVKFYTKGELLMSDGARIPVSVRKRKTVLEQI